MFTKLTRSGGLTYVQLVESFRDESGRPRQRTNSNAGRLDEVVELGRTSVHHHSPLAVNSWKNLFS